MRTLAGRSTKGKSVRAAAPVDINNLSITEENSGGEDNHNNTTLPDIKRQPRKVETESLKQSLKRMQLLNMKPGEDTRDVGMKPKKSSYAYDSSHRRNTTLPKNEHAKTNNIKGEYTRNSKSHLLDASRALSTDGAYDTEKVVAINEYLKQKIDVSKLNLRMF